MALLAEELVEEWLNRQGYFTIRGIALGVHEIDLLAIRPTTSKWDLRHVEVQASVRPVSYISRVPKDVQKETGRAATSAKERTLEELVAGVNEWIHKKFALPRKVELKRRLAPGEWSRELVVHRLRHEEELDEFRRQGIKVHRLSDLVAELESDEFPISAASGAAFVDLILMGDSIPDDDDIARDRS